MTESATTREGRRRATSYRISVCAQELTEERGLEGFTMEELAEAAGVSRRTLELRFRAAFGKGPADVFRARRLELSQRLLAETDLSVAEIAARTGSGSVQSFTTLFRRTFGFPPAEYRRRVRDGAPPALSATT